MLDKLFSKIESIVADGFMYLILGSLFGIFLFLLGFYLFDKHNNLIEPVIIYRETIDKCIQQCSTNKNLWNITIQNQTVTCHCLNNANFYMKN